MKYTTSKLELLSWLLLVAFFVLGCLDYLLASLLCFVAMWIVVIVDECLFYKELKRITNGK